MKLLIFTLLLLLPLSTLARRRTFKNLGSSDAQYTSFRDYLTRPRFNVTSPPSAVADAFIAERLSKLTFVQYSAYVDPDSGVGHVYYVQTINGRQVWNSLLNFNILKTGDVWSYGSTVPKDAAKKVKLKQRELGLGMEKREEPRISAVEALKSVVDKLEIAVEAGEAEAVPVSGVDAQGGNIEEEYVLKGVHAINGEVLREEPSAKLLYHREGDEFKLVWRVKLDLRVNALEVYQDAAEAGKVWALLDHVCDASEPLEGTYRVYKIDLASPLEGNQSLERGPWSSVSPSWHTTAQGLNTSVVGNNVQAQEDFDENPQTGNYRPDGGEKLIFDYPFPTNVSDPRRPENLDPAITQVFYTSNILHDYFYLLGFHDAAGAAQEVDMQAGGVAGDPLRIEVQTMDSEDNAFCLPTPDGVQPRITMGLWNQGDNTKRDSSLENSIIAHEYAHLVSTRLTGGPVNINCLLIDQSQGMGEGWSDFIATAIRIKKGDTRTTEYNIAEWVNGGRGNRKYSYTTDKSRNPLTFASVQDMPPYAVHDIGNVWASILVDMLWIFVEKKGFVEDLKPAFQPFSGPGGNPVPKGGRNWAVKLVIEAMKLQPCFPDFIMARNAIVDAEYLLTGGQNLCEVWGAFARRGLGVNARIESKKIVEDFTTIRECPNWW